MDVGSMVGGTVIFTMVIVVFSTLVPIVAVVGIFLFMAKKRQENQQLVATGMPGQAMIVQMGDTGVRINNQPRLSLTLDVHPVQGMSHFAAFRTTHETTVPMMAMARVAPGTTVPVKLDPQNPSRLTIDWSALGYAM